MACVVTAFIDFDEALQQGGWLGACGCTTDSNLATKLGHYCECEPPENFDLVGNITIDPICLEDGFERLLANACIGIDNKTNNFRI